MENQRKILFVDDQWCLEDNQEIISGSYGSLQREGYDFAYETAFNSLDYSVEKVVERVRKENPTAVVLDMDFNEESRSSFDGSGFGKKILGALVRDNSNLPVFIHSSSEDEDLKNKCLEIGAKIWLYKRTPVEILREALNKYCE